MAFDAAKIKDECAAWIREFFEENGKGCNAVVGISGGKDSSVTAALCVEALGKDRVIGVLMPDGEQPDIDMAKLLVEHLGIEHYVVNIKDSTKGLKDAIPFELSDHYLYLKRPEISHDSPDNKQDNIYSEKNLVEFRVLFSV